MTAVLSSELFKLRSTRGPWAVALAVIAVASAMFALFATLVGRPGQPALTPASLTELAAAPGLLAGAAALVFGLLLTTVEYRHATVLTTRLGHPRVTSLLVGRTAAAVLAGGALAAAVELIMVGGGAALLASRDFPVELLHHGIPAAVFGVVAVGALLGVIGVAVGELLRSPALAIGAVTGWVFVVEGVLPVVLRNPELARWLPASVARAALTVGQPLAEGALHPAAGLAALAAYATVLWLAGLARSRLVDP